MIKRLLLAVLIILIVVVSGYLFAYYSPVNKYSFMENWGVYCMLVFMSLLLICMISYVIISFIKGDI